MNISAWDDPDVQADRVNRMLAERERAEDPKFEPFDAPHFTGAARVIVILGAAAVMVEQVIAGRETADSVRGDETLGNVLTALKVWPAWEAGDHAAVLERINRAISFNRDPTAFLVRPEHIFRNIKAY